MCGISALFLAKPRGDLRRPFEQSLDRILHRGPDGRGTRYGQGSTVTADGDAPFDWALGHVRLSILDLSPAGAQPMSYGDGRIWITFNGEVYNYVELRTELKRAGCSFRSHTDTEVVLAAYRTWGSACVGRFRGMFALVIVDLDRRRVFAARDPLGIKPLYFHHFATDYTAVVSEPKQLAAYPTFRPRADRQQLLDFLVDGVLGHDADRSCFDGVTPLAPGHSLEWQLGELPDLSQAQAYWQPPLASQSLDWNDARARTGDLFRETIKLHLRSDVPVGSCLSGGIDSSSIVGVVAREHGVKMHTFSSCSKQTEFDEQPYIDAVNRHCNTRPLKIFPEPEECLADLDTIVYHQDEPFGSLSVYAQYRVMQAARRAKVPVVLDGQGGDEALCGYRKFALLHLKQLLSRRQIGAALKHVLNLLRGGDGGLLQLSAGQRYLPKWLRSRSASAVELLQPSWRADARHVWNERMRSIRSLHDVQWADLRQWSLPALLRYEDRNSMAHAIEARVPFVEHRFLEHCLTLPEPHFFRRGQTKRVLVEAIADSLPTAVRERRTKMGFVTPQSQWMRGAVGAALAQRVEQSEALRSIVDVPAVLRGFQDLAADKPTLSEKLLFRTASVAMWIDRFGVAA